MKVDPEDGNQLLRVAIPVSSDILRILEKVEALKGVRPFDFSVDMSGTMTAPEGALWLVWEVVNPEEVEPMHDIVAKAGGLPIKTAGILKREKVP